VRKILTAATTASLLLATLAANAADLSVQPPPLPPPPAYRPPAFSWTAFYLGVNIGGAWAQRNWADSFFGLNFDNSSSNGMLIGGGQLGVNGQFGSFVVGVEWDFDFAGSSNNAVGIAIPAIGNTFVVTSNNRWISTIAARFGVALDRILVYGKAGGGWVANDGFNLTNVTAGTSITGGSSNTAGGWLVGAGIEWAFVPSWTFKVEYDYLGLSNRTFVVPMSAAFLAGDIFTSNRNVQTVKLGFNYLLNWGGPIFARY
jgi:outer membrane immunogenic protein